MENWIQRLCILREKVAGTRDDLAKREWSPLYIRAKVERVKESLDMAISDLDLLIRGLSQEEEEK